MLKTGGEQISWSNIFLNADVEAILQMPLPRSQEEDEVLWHFHKRGEYSVKSGYQLALNLKFPNEPSSSSDSNSRQWKFLWMLELPEKIKIFMWRVTKNILPTAENLWGRKSLQEPIYQRYKKNVGTIKHVLLE